MSKYHITPVHPGAVLQDEIDELGITQAALAGHINVLPKTINEICRGKRGISAEMAIKLSQALGASPQFWLNLQTNWALTRTSHKFENRCEARQNEIRDGSVLAHVTKRIAAITLPRALVVLRFLLNSTEETDCIWPNPTAPCYLANYSRSAETGEIFGLSTRVLRPQRNPLPARPQVPGRTRFLPTLLASLFALFAETAASQPPDRPPAEAAGARRAALFEIQIGEQMVSLELAVSPHEQERGLMFRKSLDPREGMLFVYPRGGRRSFWMRNTSIPLDLGFFSEDGILREIRPLYPFDESPVVSRRRDIKFAVEMRQGWYSAHGVRPGSSLDLQALREALKARGIDPEAFSL